jgi:hypothetical protein
MIDTLIKSAFQTGCLSVESEGLIHQVVTTKCYQPQDLVGLTALYAAISAGKIKREASTSNLLELPALNITD